LASNLSASALVFTATAAREQIYYQLSNSDRLSGRQTLGVLEVQKGLPIASQQMPGHAVSPTQRAFEISSLVNSCLAEARREQRFTDLSKLSVSSLLTRTLPGSCVWNKAPLCVLLSGVSLQNAAATEAIGKTEV
ncbi:hypothetical protein KUCAC02_019126, partial [Chaenocephalus aceratus]